MPSNPYPTLSPSGFITNPKAKAQWIFADYLASKHSQSTVFYGSINSISFDEYQGEFDPDITSEFVKNSLEAEFEAYFDQVTIEVTDTSSTDITTSIGIYAELIDGAVTVKLNEVLSFTNGVLDKPSKTRQ